MNTVSPRILIVEDEEYLARALQDNLVPRGCLIDIADNGEKALEYLSHNIPDLVVLDLVMPRRDGFYVLQHIKDNEVWKHIPVFILSNLGETDDIKRAMDLGADDYFIKSHNTILEVITRIMQLLEKKATTPDRHKK